MATATTAQPSVCVDGGSSSATTEPEWVTQLLSRHDPSTSLPKMYTAPKNMRSADTDDRIFEPVVVSIGPFHDGEFPDMAEHKTRLFSSMLSRHCNMDKRKLLMELVDAARMMEKHAKGYYSKSFEDIDFVKMMVFDGCFLLEIFHIFTLKDKNDPLWMARWMLPVLALDIVKVENQLPYFVLETLFGITRSAYGPLDESVTHLAGPFLSFVCSRINLFRSREVSKELFSSSQRHTHLLSLFHSTFASCENPPDTPVNDGRCIPRRDVCLHSFPSATDLSYSGIKVRANWEQGNPLEIEYCNGVLKIPILAIDHSTKILMRNMVAYEQCNKAVSDIFTSYVIFMDGLVNSPEDVEVLRTAGVVDHSLKSSEEVSELLNNLTANLEIDMNEGYLADLNAQIYADYHRALPRFRTRFRRLVNSREGMVYIITIFALYLTVLQTVFTVLSYFLPR